MDYSQCSLYGLREIAELEALLKTDLHNYSYSGNLWHQYHIELVDGRRIIESPNESLKFIQRQILSFLNELDYPQYLFSVKGRSFVDGVAIHIPTADHLIKIDIYKFFFSTGREKVFRFWKDKMNSSKTVANVLTNLTTLDLRRCTICEVVRFLDDNSLCKSHLGFGLPSSIALSYLCNIDMFEELERYSEENNFNLSVYVDDVILSRNSNIKRSDFDSVRKIVMDHGYKINKKSKYRNGNVPIVVTGLYLSKKGLGVPNEKQKEYSYLKTILANECVSSNDELRCKGLKEYISSIKRKNEEVNNRLHK